MQRRDHVVIFTLLSLVAARLVRRIDATWPTDVANGNFFRPAFAIGPVARAAFCKIAAGSDIREQAAGLATTIAEDCDAIRMLAIVDTKTAFGSWLTLSKFEYVCISAVWRASDTRAGGNQRSDCLMSTHILKLGNCGGR